MTVEGSHETPQGQTAPQAANRQSMGSQQLRIVLLVVVVAAVGVGAWLAFGHSAKHKKKSHNLTTAIGPVALSKSKLSAQALALGQPMYWAGPMKGFHYEFWRLKSDRIYVRYLPVKVKAGAPGKNYLIIGTYPLPHAYKSLKKLAKGKGVKGPNGSFIWQRTGAPNSVYVVWPKVPYEIEVYDPHPSKSASIAESGQVKTVG